jgi:hypothetical protein
MDVQLDDGILREFYLILYRKVVDSDTTDVYSKWVKEFARRDTRGFERLAHSTGEALWNNIDQVLAPLETDYGLASSIIMNIAGKEFHGRLRASFNHLVKLKAALREYKWVVFVGAGVSFGADFGNETVNGCVANCCGVALEEVRAEYRRMGLRYKYWDMMDAAKVADFKLKLTQAVDDKKHTTDDWRSDGHKLLGDMFENGKIEHLVCFSWDDLIEYGRGFAVVVGISEAAPTNARFWKPHGCVSRHADPAYPWILPNQPSQIHPALVNLFHRFIKNKKSRVAISIGFSGDSNFTISDIKGYLGGVDALDIRPEYKANRDLGILISLGASYALYWLQEYILKT